MKKQPKSKPASKTDVAPAYVPKYLFRLSGWDGDETVETIAADTFNNPREEVFDFYTSDGAMVAHRTAVASVDATLNPAYTGPSLAEGRLVEIQVLKSGLAALQEGVASHRGDFAAIEFLVRQAKFGTRGAMLKRIGELARSARLGE